VIKTCTFPDAQPKLHAIVGGRSARDLWGKGGGFHGRESPAATYSVPSGVKFARVGTWWRRKAAAIAGILSAAVGTHSVEKN